MTALADELPVHRDDPWYSKSQWPWWYLCEDVKRNWGAYLPITAKFFFYLSIKSRSFPSLWKKLNIVLIPKANDNRNPSNYWTIYLSASYLWSPTLLFPMIETLQLLCLMAVKWPLMICSDCTEKWNHPRLQKLQHNIHAISEWLSANPLHLNVS